MEKIQQAFVQLLLTVFADWSQRIAWENKSFTAPKGQPWMAFFFMPVDSKVATLGQTGYDEENGMVQIDLNYPIGVGESDSRKTINDLRTCFRPRVISYGGQNVTILGRNRSHGRTRGDFYCIPFTIRWRSQLTRN